jgi:TRAP-type mannitol/chloroaromatic compound transport system substrate-binding protein
MFLWGPSICSKIRETLFMWAFGQNCTEVHKIVEKSQWENVSQDCAVVIQKSKSRSGAVF